MTSGFLSKGDEETNICSNSIAICLCSINISFKDKLHRRFVVEE